MGLPVVLRTAANLLMSATTSGNRTETVTTGETAFVVVGVVSGGDGASVTGAGATWTQIRNDSDGTRRAIIFRGTGLSTGSQTVTLSFTNTTTCRWSWVAASGISAVAPDDASDTKTTANSTRTSTDAAASLTTANNVLVVFAVAVTSGTSLASIVVPTSFTRITGASSGVILAHAALSTGLSASTLTSTHSSATNAAVGSAASFNGDDPATKSCVVSRRNLRSPHARM